MLSKRVMMNGVMCKVCSKCYKLHNELTVRSYQANTGSLDKVMKSDESFCCGEWKS